MNYSRVYTTFGGVMEMLVVLLLCFRRTATLGALICVPVMLNVALINFCYGVPVKLFSSMIILSALVLVAFEARRLVDIFVLHRAAPADPPRPLFRSPALNAARWVVKLVVVGGVIASSIHAMVTFPLGAEQPLAGTWEVTSFVRVDLVQGHAAPRWQRLAVGRFGASLRLDSGASVGCGIAGAAPKLVLDCAEGHGGELVWTRAGDALRLDGTFDNAAVSVTLERHDGARLVDTPFLWIFD
jgi:hypothetical protein